MNLIFVEKAEIVINAQFPLYKRKKVWYNKTVVGQTETRGSSFCLQSFCFRTVEDAGPYKKHGNIVEIGLSDDPYDFSTTLLADRVSGP